MMKRTMTLLFGLVLAWPLWVGAESEDTARDAAIRTMVGYQIGPEYLEMVYVEAAQAASNGFLAEVGPILKRAPTEQEKQEMVLFWHGEIKQLLSYPRLQDLLVPVFARHFSLEEIQEINRFYESPVGRKLTRLAPVMASDARQAAMELVSSALGDEKWKQAFVERLLVRFPYLLKERRPAPKAPESRSGAKT